jgi:hypothetical protein
MNRTTDERENRSAVLDGHQIWTAMRRLSFEGFFFDFSILVI